MIRIRHCPTCDEDTAQLHTWHRLVPEDHTRYYCIKGCQSEWDEYDPHPSEDPSDPRDYNPSTTV
jgi:hypothetical protein